MAYGQGAGLIQRTLVLLLAEALKFHVPFEADYFALVVTAGA